MLLNVYLIDSSFLKLTLFFFFFFLFQLAEQPLLDAIKITLGDRYSDNMDIIYKLVIRFLLTEVTKAARVDVSWCEISITEFFF